MRQWPKLCEGRITRIDAAESDALAHVETLLSFVDRESKIMQLPCFADCEVVALDRPALPI
ncbi:MAG: hypothetical protein AABO58_05990 [Acidobacteriota bacterium]